MVTKYFELDGSFPFFLDSTGYIGIPLIDEDGSTNIGSWKSYWSKSLEKYMKDAADRGIVIIPWTPLHDILYPGVSR